MYSSYWPVRLLKWHLLCNDGHVDFIIERQNVVTAYVINLKGTDGSLNRFSLIMCWLVWWRNIPIKKKKESLFLTICSRLGLELRSCQSRHEKHCLLWTVLSHNKPSLSAAVLFFIFTPHSSNLTSCLISIIQSGDYNSWFILTHWVASIDLSTHPCHYMLVSLSNFPFHYSCGEFNIPCDESCLL